MKSWRTTVIGVSMLAVGGYLAFTGTDSATVALFISGGTGFILSKDSACD